MGKYIDLILIKSTDNTYLQLFRYTLVGGFSFVIDFAMLFFLTEYGGVYYLMSAGIAFLFGLIVNYSLSVKWVFMQRKYKNKINEFMIFGIIGIAGLIINELGIWFFTEILCYFYLISKIITTLFVYLWNFFARKFILFN